MRVCGLLGFFASVFAMRCSVVVISVLKLIFRLVFLLLLPQSRNITTDLELLYSNVIDLNDILDKSPHKRRTFLCMCF